MTELARRRRALMGAVIDKDEDLVESFTPFTKTFGQNDNVAVPLTERIIQGMAYRVVVDATVPEGFRLLILLGAVNNTIQYYPGGQDGIVERSWTTATYGNMTTANVYIYCRKVSGSGTVSAVVRSIKVYRDGWIGRRLGLIDGEYADGAISVSNGNKIVVSNPSSFIGNEIPLTTAIPIKTGDTIDIRIDGPVGSKAKYIGAVIDGSISYASNNKPAYYTWYTLSNSVSGNITDISIQAQEAGVEMSVYVILRINGEVVYS